MMKNSQRIALVTGANRGIGLEVCRQLAQQGYRVVLTSRDEAKGQVAIKSLQKADGAVVHHQLDVTSAHSIQRLRDFVVSELGRVDVLVNNAAIYADRNLGILNAEHETVRATMETNVFGPLMLCQALLPLMRQHNYGRIVNVSSSMGQFANLSSSSPAYRLSKTALNALTVMLADAVRGRNILINAACPGWVRTDMGGRGAPRSVAEGADTIVWLATLPEGGPNGGLFSDRRRIEW